MVKSICCVLVLVFIVLSWFLNVHVISEIASGAPVVACKNNPDKTCSPRRECKKCKICKPGAGTCCCLHFDRCTCSITLPNGVVKKCCAE